MCRLTAYKGKPLLIGDLIVKPENGLMFQSRDAGWHPGVIDGLGKRNIRVNADGFGVAWYSRPTIHDSEELLESEEIIDSVTGLREHMYESCTFKFITPAWSNRNLKNIGQHVRSSLIFAHIRAGSTGLNIEDSLGVSVAEENCHPFQFRQWTFMHNGGVPSFHMIKYPLMQILDEDSFNKISGNTDSEYIFALFLSLLPDKHDLNVDLKVFAKTVERTIACILELCQTYNKKAGSSCACSLNLVISDGCHIIATRFRTGCRAVPGTRGTDPPSLYYNWGSNFVCEEGQFFMGDRKSDCGCNPNEIVISSAPLSKCDDLVLDTRSMCAAGYPRDMFLDLGAHSGSGGSGDELQNSTHSASSHSTLHGDATPNSNTTWVKDVPRRKRSDTLDGFDRSDNYRQMGQWVLMPPNHMLVCVGCPDNPSHVVDVFLHDISNVCEDHPGTEAAQRERKQSLNELYSRRNRVYAKEVGTNRKRAQQAASRRARYGEEQLESDDPRVGDTRLNSDRPSSPCPPARARVIGRGEEFPESPTTVPKSMSTKAEVLPSSKLVATSYPHSSLRHVRSTPRAPDADDKSNHYRTITSSWDVRSLINASLPKASAGRSRGFSMGEGEREDSVVLRISKRSLCAGGLMLLSFAAGYAMTRHSR
jgi:glutamine amidotransferase